MDGNRFFDFTAGFGVMALGYNHPEVRQAATEQLDRCPHAMGDAFPADIKLALMRKLLAISGAPFTRVLLGNSGSDAVEAALKTAILWGEKQRQAPHGILAFDGAYHGLSFGALSLTAYSNRFRWPFVHHLNPGVARVPFPNCYRCPLGQSRPSCQLACLQLVASQLAHPASGLPPLAAILLEPIQGRGGVLLPPPGYLEGLAALARRHGLLLILDEIFTGMGRCGSWFAYQHFGLSPDLVTVGKGMTGGFPISALISTEEAMDGWQDCQGEAIHTSTFLGHPVGCAMALQVLTRLEASDLFAQVQARGAYLAAAFARLAHEFPVIGDSRGLGLLWGLELVSDRASRKPAGQLALQVCRQLLERGVILLPAGAHGNVLSISPPLTVGEDELAFFITELSSILKALA